MTFEKFFQCCKFLFHRKSLLHIQDVRTNSGIKLGSRRRLPFLQIETIPCDNFNLTKAFNKFSINSDSGFVSSRMCNAHGIRQEIHRENLPYSRKIKMHWASKAGLQKDIPVR